MRIRRENCDWELVADPLPQISPQLLQFARRWSVLVRPHITQTQIHSTVILYYDWLLTFDEEVRYAWMAPKTSGVWLFLLNRYFTSLVVSTGPESQSQPSTNFLRQYVSVCVANFTPFDSVDVMTSLDFRLTPPTFCYSPGLPNLFTLS